MNKIKLCCFTVNTTHAYIIANNFINNELENVKVVYINERSEKRKLKNLISKFYKRINDKSFYTEWLNEQITNDYENEEFVFVINGKQSFVDKVNEYIQLNNFKGYIINCYDIFDMKVDTYEIISKHDYYINTSGIVKKEAFNKK